MKLRRVLALLLLAPAPAAAQWDSRLELVGFGAAFAQRQNLPAEAALPDRMGQAEIRWDMSFDKGRASLALKPRFGAETVGWSGERRERAEAFIGQALARLRLTHAFSVSAGREILTWGPALLRSPSNPFYPDNGRANPVRELPGLDVVRASFAPSVHWDVTLLGNLRQGRLTPAGATFRRSLLLKIDAKRGSHNGSVNVMKAEAEAPRVGAYAQVTVAGSLLLYGEAGTGPVAWDTRVPVTLLGGGNYTFPSGISLILEALRNEEGRAAVLQSSAPLSTGLLWGHDAGRPLLGRHYLFAQLQNNPAQGGKIWQARYTYNADDGSGQASAYLEGTVFSRLSPFVLVGICHGAPGSEFGAGRDRMMMAGTRIFAW